jgi:hypothetical protein
MVLRNIDILPHQYLVSQPRKPRLGSFISISLVVYEGTIINDQSILFYIISNIVISVDGLYFYKE